MAKNLPVRLAKVTTGDVELVDYGVDAPPAKKTCGVRKGPVGHVASFEGGEFVTEFAKNKRWEWRPGAEWTRFARPSGALRASVAAARFR